MNTHGGTPLHSFQAHRGKRMQKMKADSLADLVKMAVRLASHPRKTHGTFYESLD